MSLQALTLAVSLMIFVVVMIKSSCKRQMEVDTVPRADGEVLSKLRFLFCYWNTFLKGLGQI